MTDSTKSNNFISTLFSKIPNNFRQSFIILFIAAIFICITIYVYRKYVSPRINPSYVPNKEFTTGENISSNDVDLYFFKVSWCPHCKTAQPIWDDLKDEYQNKSINGYNINFNEIDCEADTDTAEKYNVEGYPTIKLQKQNQIIEYDAKPDKDTLVKFLNTTLA